MAVVRQIRSWMFGPGNREKFITKAKKSPADCVLLDLEDGVLPLEKADARKMVMATLAEAWEGGPQRYVRLNALNTLGSRTTWIRWSVLGLTACV